MAKKRKKKVVRKGKQDIPKSVERVIHSQSKRKELPASYFLLPSERKFPYKDPKTGAIDCALLRAAITRAAQYGYTQVENKARRLYEQHCKKKK